MAALTQNFSPDDLSVLHRVPLWIFYEVAGADSVIDEEEILAFERMLADASNLRDQFSREVFTSMSGTFTDILRTLKVGMQGSLLGLQRAMEILARKTTPEVCAEFKLLVFVMGWTVAAASGDEGDESNISAEEIANLTRIAEVLTLNTAKLRSVIVSRDGDKVWKGFLNS
jgi:uncharacterized membrane protein